MTTVCLIALAVIAALLAVALAVRLVIWLGEFRIK